MFLETNFLDQKLFKLITLKVGGMIIITKLLENIVGVNPLICRNGIAFAISSTNNSITENTPTYNQAYLYSDPVFFRDYHKILFGQYCCLVLSLLIIQLENRHRLK